MLYFKNYKSRTPQYVHQRQSAPCTTVIFQLCSTESWGSDFGFQGFRQHISFIIKPVIIIVNYFQLHFLFSSPSLCMICAGFFKCKSAIRIFFIYVHKCITYLNTVSLFLFFLPKMTPLLQMVSAGIQINHKCSADKKRLLKLVQDTQFIRLGFNVSHFVTL